MRIAPDPIRSTPRPSGRRRLVELLIGVGVLAALLALGQALLRPALVDLGSTAEERAASMPADDVVADPRTVMTRSVTLSAPPDEVWPWLVQMGVGKGGFYGYDWLENLGPVGLIDEIVNADRVHPEWQGLAVGDHVAPLPGSTDWTVTQLVPERLLVIESHRDWTWVLQLRPVGQDRTRLVTRMRWAPASAVGGQVGGLVFDLGDLVVMARTLHGLEQRVTGTLPGMPGTPSSDPAPPARLPVPWSTAVGWLAALALLGAATARLLVSGRGGWVLTTTTVTVLAWCLWTDTDPWRALAHHWTAAVATGLLALALVLRRTARLEVRRAVPALCVAGVAVVLPALTVWDAAVTAGLTDGALARVVVVGLAAAAAVLTSLGAWWAARSHPGLLGLSATFGVAALTLATGSVLAGAAPGALGLLALLDPPAHTTREIRKGTETEDHHEDVRLGRHDRARRLHHAAPGRQTLGQHR